MKPINESLVYSLGPTVFRHGSVIRDGGLRCSEGWLSIIVDLVMKLEMRARKTPPGQQQEIRCIKEKMGILRVYVSQINKFDDLDIEKAVEKSKTTCEDCGGEGKPYSDGWMRTLCEPCVLNWKVVRQHAARN